ncbi:MAG: hypothetical protein CL955_07605 [Erythrobacteraceae bacterium]|nr:hypothetical protein [Erythrobacteraceae bacterium]
MGTPFRLHGRDPRTGLDCVGLVHASLVKTGRRSTPPEGYRLRNTDPSRWFDFAEYSGLCRVSGPVVRGDVLLIKAAPGQQHLLIAEHPVTAIHAHAGLRRVVRETIVFPNMPIAHWRLQP